MTTEIECSNGSKIALIVVDGSDVDLFTEEFVIEVRDKMGKIESITIDNIEFRLGTTVSIESPYPVSYNVGEIQKHSNHYTLRTSRKTDTSIFIMPAINSNIKHYIRSKYFVNAYLKKVEGGVSLKSLYIEYRFFDSSNFTKFEESMINDKGFIKTHNVNPEFIIFEFELNPIYMEDLKLLLKGKYSEISKAYKQRVIDFNMVDPIKSNIAAVLFRNPKYQKYLEHELDTDLSSVELYSKINIKKESICIE